jgi:SAM-dependent methyltransferase
MADKVRGKEKRSCAICGGARKRLLFQQHFSVMSSGAILDGYDVVVCEDCGFGFADNLPGQDAFDEYYREMSKYEQQDHGGRHTAFDARRFPANASIIMQFLPDRQARILDIGCATGGLLHTLAQNGYQNLLGLDPSPVCARTAAELYGVSVRTGTLSDVSADIGTFDLIILGAVLEHIRNLKESLLQIRDLLSEAGMLFIEVPDATKFADSADAPFQEFSIEHINFFSVTSLTNLLRVCGFTQIHSQRTPLEQRAGKVAHEINSLYQKSCMTQQPLSIFDMETKPALEAYVARSEEIEQRVRFVVDAWADGGRPMIVWGAGTHTQRLLAVSRLAKANIQAFVDSNPRYHGKQFNGIPIISPAAVKGRNEPILISSRDFQEVIARQIRDELKYNNELILLYDS